jgi:xylan 1,4-beta-xylosidase
MKRLPSRIAAAVSIAFSIAAVTDGFAAQGPYPTCRNLFQEYLGVSYSSLDTKIDVAWNQLFYGDDSDQRIYYPVDDNMAYILDTGNGDVRSEGMSYGMTIAVQLDHKAEFDRLWKWVKTHMYHADGTRKGYYSWQCKTDGTPIDEGSASDGEEWFVTALFLASGRWGDGDGIYCYSAEANAILDTMLHKGDEGLGAEKTINMFDMESKQVRFAPLAFWAKVTDASYQLPAFYELWALWAEKDNEFWAGAAQASREYFHKAANPETGLIPDISDFNGKPYAWKNHEHFSYDAHRAIANIAIDYAWFGKDAWQAEQSERVLKFLSSYSPSIPCEFTLDGKPCTQCSSTSITAMAAVGALAANRDTGRTFVHDLWDVAIPTGKYRYYDGLLYMIGMLECGGRFHLYVPVGKPDPFKSNVSVKFLKFEYSGYDRCFENAISPSEYRNPILPGFRPDPSICKVGDDYYLVNSSFAYFPGIPIYHSKDLVHWTQLGHVIDRPDQINLTGVGISRGILAPSISYHDGTFYVVTTLIDRGGNFYVTAKNPSGPWSDPVWLKEVEGVDPSFFFDDSTGKAYLINNGAQPDGKPLYEGHRAIWIQEFDVASQKLIGPRQVIVNGGSDIGEKPVWIEGPHIFKRNGWYYLICAEGGTGTWHSEVVFRSISPLGPWISWMNNPILTQRDVSPDRPMPVTSTGHAEFVDTGIDGWWAVFLGCRPHSGDRYVTGRETFLLPVTWTSDEWPVILPHGSHVQYVAKAPELDDFDEANLYRVPSGNFTWSDDFSGDKLSPFWLMLRNPHTKWYETGGAKSDGLKFEPLRINLDSYRQPAYLAYRIQHSRFTAILTLVPPDTESVESGLALFQSEFWNMFMGVHRDGDNLELFLEQASGSATEVISRERIKPYDLTAPLKLRVELDGDSCTFSYSFSESKWIVLATVESSPLTTQRAGGFVGATIGPFARIH